MPVQPLICRAPSDVEPSTFVAPKAGSRWAIVFAVVLGAALTLCIRGYRFGESNHAVYLVDALRRNDPRLLQNDWWARSTLQYHVVFNVTSAWLLRLGIIEPVFLIGYLFLAVLLHVAWLRWVRRLGGELSAYLSSVVLYYLLAGGTGLGMYQFLQDGEFLPSNISNVAMLWGLYWWTARRPLASGTCLGIAALFHLNYAIAGGALWGALSIAELIRARRRRASGDSEGIEGRQWLIGTAILAALGMVSLLPALKAVLAQRASLPLAEFVELYVRLRHPHHYDPSSWPWWLWASFLLPVLAGAIVFWRARAGGSGPQRRTALIFVLMLALIGIALIGAGIWYVSEALIQMSLYRFSIFPKLLGCMALAIAARRTRPLWICSAAAALAFVAIAWLALFLRRGLAPALDAFVALNFLSIELFFALAAVALLIRFIPLSRRVSILGCGAVIGVIALSWTHLGIRVPGLEMHDAAYLRVCHWARANTPLDGVFLVPPDEEVFRLRARRAIVVNFKGVPQLSSELGEWRDRLRDVLAMADLRALPRPLYRTLPAIAAQYDSAPSSNLATAGRKYGARYVLLRRALPDEDAIGARLIHSDGGYFLYDLPP